MLCEGAIGNVYRDDAGRFTGKEHDPVDLTWQQCNCRAVRARSRGGRHVGILYPRGIPPRDGDVLFEDGPRIGVISVAACEVCVALITDAALAAKVAIELGNLHLPVEVEAGPTLIFQPDGPALRVLRRYHVPWRNERRRFQPLRATATAVKLGPGLRAAGAE